MSSITWHRQLQDALGKADLLAASLTCLRSSLVKLQESLPGTECMPPAASVLRRARAANAELALIDEAVFSVILGKRRCFLGNTLPFRFFVRLHRQPNLYVSYEQLLVDVWEDQFRTREAIRSVAKDLRSRLRRDQMNELADAIDGSVAGHYALRWPMN